MAFCLELADARAGEAEAGATIGGKARSLVRLAAAGLPVPPAFVVTSELFRALRAGGPAVPAELADAEAVAAADDAAGALAAAPWPAGFEDGLARALARLERGGSFSVRSSAE